MAAAGSGPPFPKFISWHNAKFMIYLSCKQMEEQRRERMKENSIRVIVVEPEKAPEVRIIANELKELQNIVKGYIETFYIGTTLEGRIYGICNEEGKLLGMEPNRLILSLRDWICGPFLIAIVNDEGDFVSMPELTADFIANDFTDRIIIL